MCVWEGVEWREGGVEGRGRGSMCVGRERGEVCVCGRGEWRGGGEEACVWEGRGEKCVCVGEGSGVEGTGRGSMCVGRRGDLGIEGGGQWQAYTVVSRKYAPPPPPPPPPFATIASVQNAGGAYTRDATISLVITPPLLVPIKHDLIVSGR